MKPATLKELKTELNDCSQKELVDLCLHLLKFKKENKELLTYLLFESHNETGYIESVKSYMDDEFETINTNSFFFIRKSARKILRNVKKFIRYSQKKETEVELLIYYCQKLKHFKPSINNSAQLLNVYNRQLLLIKKITAKKKREWNISSKEI